MTIDNNPLILAIESTGATCGVALEKGDTVIGSYSLFGINLHDKILSEFIRRLLNDTETSIDALSAVAVSAGPGSFTGLRIGAAVAKGICFENHPKLIAVPTMKSLALASSKRFTKQNYDYLVIIQPFYKDQYYFQIFDSKLNEIKPIETIDRNFFNNLKHLEEYRNSFFISPDISLKELFHNSFLYMPLLADYIAQSGYVMFQAEEFVLSEEFSPLYVKEFVPKFKIISD